MKCTANCAALGPTRLHSWYCWPIGLIYGGTSTFYFSVCMSPRGAKVASRNAIWPSVARARAGPTPCCVLTPLLQLQHDTACTAVIVVSKCQLPWLRAFGALIWLSACDWEFPVNLQYLALGAEGTLYNPSLCCSCLHARSAPCV